MYKRQSYTLAIIDIFGELKNLEKHSITKDLEDPSVFERILEDASAFLLKNDQKPVGVGMALPGPYPVSYTHLSHRSGARRKR